MMGVVVLLALAVAAGLTYFVSRRFGVGFGAILPAIAGAAAAWIIISPPAAQNAEAMKFDDIGAYLIALPALVGGLLALVLALWRRPAP